MNNYNSLSEFLKHSETINEGWLSDLLKGKKASSTQVSAAKSFFGLFGALGTGTFGTREVAYRQDDKKGYSKTFWEIFILRFPL